MKPLSFYASVQHPVKYIGSNAALRQHQLWSGPSGWVSEGLIGSPEEDVKHYPRVAAAININRFKAKVNLQDVISRLTQKSIFALSPLYSSKKRSPLLVCNIIHF